jgi:hypothetical protein
LLFVASAVDSALCNLVIRLFAISVVFRVKNNGRNPIACRSPRDGEIAESFRFPLYPRPTREAKTISRFMQPRCDTGTEHDSAMHANEIRLDECDISGQAPEA